MEKWNRYTPEFKTRVVLEVLQEEQTVNEIAAKYEVSPVMISRWKTEFLSRASMVFEKGTSEADKMKKEYESKQEHLEKLVGLSESKLWVEEEWFYTLEDIDNITNMPYMSDWCYKDPRERARD